MKVGARVSLRGGDAARSRLDKLKERLLRERARELEDEVQRRRRVGVQIEVPRTVPRAGR